MAGAEIQNFNFKFVQLWNAGHDARLTLEFRVRLLVKCNLNHDDLALPALDAVNDLLRPVQLTLLKPMLPKLLTTRSSVQLL